MSEQHDHNEIEERPQPDDEQMRAFRGAYSQLMKKARENGALWRFTTDPSTGRPLIELAETDELNKGEEFVANGTGGRVSVQYDGEKTAYGYIHSYNEEFVQEAGGRLGSFSVRFPGSDELEQDFYEFFNDGNIERLHFTTADDNEQSLGSTHTSWLNAEEMEQLAQLIENSSV